MSVHNPDRWVILKINDDTHKVFAMWSGGYLDGDSWRASSGITNITDDGEYYVIKNNSGSIYKCHKNMEGLSPYGASVLYAGNVSKDYIIPIDSIKSKYVEDSDE